MDLELYYSLKDKTDKGKVYVDNWNEFTREWSSGYRKAMQEIDGILYSFIREYEKTA